VKFNDGTYGVIDFKTAAAKSEHIPLYARQLHSYAYALENSVPGALSLAPVSKLGLLIYEPNDYIMQDTISASLKGGVSWLEIQRNDKDFINFLKEVVIVLEQPHPPGGNPECEWCRYRDTSRRMGW
jgi:CRISPR/Cas system-associated exonuclease Cas4 (RecB family)